MSDIVLKVDNLSKQYRLGEIGTGTISHDLNRWFAKIRGKEDPYSIIGQVNDRTKKAESDFVWALKDINFEVKRGEILGIIGKNGAGKSTLLKLISRITAPTTGSIKAKGRTASLLEVGTGMHPEMTARENVYLNGAIMGMTKKEITRKFDEIISFAGCDMYVDTPVKRFSSGMRVRLGFAVAAFLEPEILIVDEVLAVGDAEFQKKAIGKMKDVTNDGGRTVLFVSHNMESVKSLCNRGMVLKNGMVQFLGGVEESVQNYIEHYVEENRSRKWPRKEAPGNHSAALLSANLQKDGDPAPNAIIETGDGVVFNFVFDYKESREVQLDVTFHLFDEMNTLVFVGSTGKTGDGGVLGKGVLEAVCKIPKNLLNEGNYRIGRLLLVQNRGTVLYEYKDVLSFDVVRRNMGLGWQGQKLGVVYPKLDWEFKSISNYND
ncbi:MAG: ABC transporter ATP-binding protein [Aureispira sp.]|nr:ABC transporter ATP-binding protein [Aureispira sp.]